MLQSAPSDNFQLRDFWGDLLCFMQGCWNTETMVYKQQQLGEICMSKTSWYKNKIYNQKFDLIIHYF